MDTPAPRLKVLVLDDDPLRRMQFHQHFTRDEKRIQFHVAKNYREFVAKMQQHSPFDFVTLDHDLQDFNPAYKMDGDPLNPQEFTGMHAAQYLAAQPVHMRPRRIEIHSHNPAGAINMQTLLNHAFINASLRPFSPRTLPVV